MKGAGIKLLLAVFLLLLLQSAFGQPPVPRETLASNRGAGTGIEIVDGKSLIDLNTADEALLAALPGIGEKLAARIIQDRAENGPFLRVSDVTRVSGIGSGKLCVLTDRVWAEKIPAQ